MKLKKLAAVMLSLVMIVCMFAIPAGAYNAVHLNGTTDLVKIYIEKSNNQINVYFDGADTSKFKNFITEKVQELYNKYTIRQPWIYIRCRDEDKEKTNFQISIRYLLDANNKVVDIEHEWLFGNEWNKTEGCKFRQYNINKNGLTSGYMISISDRDVISNFSFFEAESQFKFDASFLEEEGYVDYIFPIKIIKSTASSAPAKTTLNASSKNGKATLKWTAADGAEKYQVAYSTDGGKTYKTYKTYKSTATKATFKMTKGTTYKFKVRSYKTVNGKKVYSKWSNVKTIKY